MSRLNYSAIPEKYLDFAIIALCAFFAFFLHIWGVPLFDLDEGAFAEATREMLHSGNFAATYLEGMPRYDKPILSYWFQALSVSIFGVHEFAFRLPSAIAATLWITASYQFVKKEVDRNTAIFAVLLIANTLWIALIGRAAIADAWLNLFISLSMFEIWRHWQRGDRNSLLRCYIWLGLGLLTKGPVSVAIPLLASGLFYGFHGQWRRWLKAIFNPLGWLILVALLAPWLISVYHAQGLAFFKGFLIDHNLHRFQNTREGHGGELYYYLIALPLVIMPFSGVLFKAIPKVKTFWQQPLSQFLMLWFGVVFVLVSLSKTQLPHYVLYGVTGLLIIFAIHRKDVFSGRWQCLFPLALLLLLVFVPPILTIAAEQSHRAYEHQLLARSTEVITWHYSFWALVALSLAIFITFYKGLQQHHRLVAISMVQTLFVFNVVMMVAAELQQSPVKDAALYSLEYPNKKVVAYGITMPSFSVYRQQITPKEPSEPGDLIFTRADHMPKLEKRIGAEHLKVVYHEGGIVLLEHLLPDVAVNEDDTLAQPAVKMD